MTYEDAYVDAVESFYNKNKFADPNFKRSDFEVEVKRMHPRDALFSYGRNSSFIKIAEENNTFSPELIQALLSYETIYNFSKGEEEYLLNGSPFHLNEIKKLSPEERAIFIFCGNQGKIEDLFSSMSIVEYNIANKVLEELLGRLIDRESEYSDLAKNYSAKTKSFKATIRAILAHNPYSNLYRLARD